MKKTKVSSVLNATALKSTSEACLVADAMAQANSTANSSMTLLNSSEKKSNLTPPKHSKD